MGREDTRQNRRYAPEQRANTIDQSEKLVEKSGQVQRRQKKRSHGKYRDSFKRFDVPKGM
jgi:hypothetical protein